MKIGLLGCKGTSLDLLRNLTANKIAPIKVVISLNEENATKNKVAYYQAPKIKEFCQESDIEFHYTDTYHLNNDADLELFKKLKIDLLLVIGWERLLPDDIMNTLGKYACGMHGSAYGLPKGRGRSPLNWSIITGHKYFTTCLFKYDAGMDSGDIIGQKTFSISGSDTISSLHMKNRIAMQQLVETYTPIIERGAENFIKQPELEPTFYPKRTYEDGAIDWNQKANEICALVRAVSFPYPSAFTKLNGREIKIDAAVPFDPALFHSGKAPGEILDVSYSLNEVVVSCKQGAVLIKEFNGIEVEQLRCGDIFESADTRQILDEIRGRYPESVPDHQKEI